MEKHAKQSLFAWLVVNNPYDGFAGSKTVETTSDGHRMAYNNRYEGHINKTTNRNHVICYHVFAAGYRSVRTDHR